MQINTRSVDKELVALSRARGIRALADPDTDAHLLVSSDEADGSQTFGYVCFFCSMLAFTVLKIDVLYCFAC